MWKAGPFSAYGWAAIITGLFCILLALSSPPSVRDAEVRRRLRITSRIIHRSSAG